jgi:hypothetical protein
VACDHPGARGETAELHWVSMLAEYLPKRYQASKAFVVDADGHRSETIDLVIYDGQYCPFNPAHGQVRALVSCTGSAAVRSGLWTVVGRGSARLSALLGTLVLASGCASAPVPQPGCDDVHQKEWLYGCALALAAAERLEHPPPRDPWMVLSQFAFEADDHLAERFAAACDRLIAEPGRMAEADRRRLMRSGWPADKRTCNGALHIEWLRACEADAKTVVGRSRRELLTLFSKEGGIFTRTQSSYIHRRCTALKVRATFLPVGAVVEWGESADDLIERVVVYIDPFFVAD